MVPRAHRRKPLPHRGHVVADRDRRHHDLPAARRDRTASPARRCGPLPGISAEVVNDAGNPVNGGYLALTKPWPSMLRTIWGDDKRFLETYWSRFKEQGFYFAGDGAKRDDDGAIWLLGRVDDVMLVSGHNISTTEVESALVAHPAVAEAAVVGATDADHRPGDRRLRDPARRRAEVVDRGAAQARGQDARPDLQAAPDHAGQRSCRRPDPARSCGGC